MQDDHADWEREATMMQNIYSGSTLTIAASGAKDTSFGFFAHEAPRFQFGSVLIERSQFTFEDSTTGKMRIVQVQHRGGSFAGMSPILQTRGWTLQESILSTRIVQCVESELYWRCSEGCQTESGMSLPATANLSWNVPALDLKDGSSSHEIWRKLVEDYSGRSFTFHKDRMPAMAGLVAYFEAMTNGSPCLGMWKSTLAQDLAWMRIGRLDNEKATSADNVDSKIPSWTWFSCPVAVIFEPAAANTPAELREVPLIVKRFVKIIDWGVFWHGHPFTSKLKSTRLIIEGPVQKLFIEIPANAKRFKPPYCVINNKVQNASVSPIPWRSSVQFDREEWKPARMWTCLLLQSATYRDEQGGRIDETFLLMEPLSSNSELDAFRRVGIGISRDDNKMFSSTVLRTFLLA